MINNIIRQLPATWNVVFWLTTAIIVKIILWLFFIFQLPDESLSFWGTFLGDSFSYYRSAENLYQHGVYALNVDPQSGQLMPYSGRMPGYAFLFLMFRWLFSFENTLNALVVFQVVLDAFACYALGGIALKLTHKKWAFVAGFTVYTVSTFVSLYNFSIMTESPAISFFIIGSFFLITHQDKAFRIVLAGFLLTWMFFLRPYTFPVWLLGGLWLLIHALKKKSLTAWLYFIPFLIIDGAWIYRNFKNENKIIFAQSDIWAGYDYPKARIALFKWVQSWGGDVVWWNPNAEVSVFLRSQNIQHLDYKFNSVADLPKYAYCSFYNADSLADWKKSYQLLELYPEKYRNTPGEQVLVSRMNRYAEAYRQERYGEYWGGAMLRLARIFLVHSGTTNFSMTPFNKMNLTVKAMKGGYSLLYWLVIPIGLLVSFLFLLYRMIWNRYHVIFEPMTFFLLVNVGMLCLFLLFRFMEYRYLVIFYPVGIIVWTYVIHHFFDHAGKKQ